MKAKTTKKPTVAMKPKKPAMQMMQKGGKKKC